MRNVLVILWLTCILCISPLASAYGIGVSVTPDEEYVTPTLSFTPDKDVALYTIAVQNYYNYTKTVNIYVYSSPQVALNWSHKTVNVNAYGVAKATLMAYSSQAGEYDITIVASTTDDMISTSCKLVVQEFDYASETSISGEGTFSLVKRVFDMHAAIDSESFVMSNGSIDGFVKNDYLVRHPVDKIPNFKKVSAVNTFNGNASFLLEKEKFLHSFAFGGTGARINEEFVVSNMEGRFEKIEAHTDNIVDAKTEFKTFNDFYGYFKLHAKQSLPGKGGYEEFNELFGDYEFYRHIVFKKD